MRKTKDDAQITRQTILNAAMKVFCKDGYGNARLEDIAHAAGVTRGAVYHHFGGKPVVYTALVNERFQEVNSLIKNIALQPGTPKELLRKLMTAMLEQLENNEEYRSIQELVLFKTAFIPELEEGMKYKIQSTKHTIYFIEKIMKEGVRSGELKANLNTRSAALSFIGLISGISSLWLLDEGLFSIKRQAETMADFFFNGIAV
jgi:TetR/AcrR family acrAB operon transcriptional repressor